MLDSSIHVTFNLSFVLQIQKLLNLTEKFTKEQRKEAAMFFMKYLKILLEKLEIDLHKISHLSDLGYSKTDSSVFNSCKLAEETRTNVDQCETKEMLTANLQIAETEKSKISGDTKLEAAEERDSVSDKSLDQSHSQGSKIMQTKIKEEESLKIGPAKGI